jgi:hypothetical protein
MNDPHLRTSDYVAAILTPVASLTLAEINAIVGIVGGLTGFSYLIWKWRKEAKRRDSLPPFE